MRAFIRSNEVEGSELDGEWLFLNLQAYTITILNEIGGFCWELLHKERTIEDIVKAVEERYILENQDESIQQDVEIFISELVSYGLVRDAG